ncbi:MAG: hypothetical protein IKE63_01325 [Bacilli bacterium]|nr:hypothetical protein [Bacilli bacterium]
MENEVMNSLKDLENSIEDRKKAFIDNLIDSLDEDKKEEARKIWDALNDIPKAIDTLSDNLNKIGVMENSMFAENTAQAEEQIENTPVEESSEIESSIESEVEEAVEPVAEAIEEQPAETPVVEDSEEVVEVPPFDGEDLQDDLEEALSEEVITETPVVEETPQEVVAEAPVVEETSQEVVAEAPVVDETSQEVVAEAPVVEETPQEVIAEAPVVEEAPQSVAIPQINENALPQEPLTPTESVDSPDQLSATENVAPATNDVIAVKEYSENDRGVLASKIQVENAKESLPQQEALQATVNANPAVEIPTVNAAPATEAVPTPSNETDIEQMMEEMRKAAANGEMEKAEQYSKAISASQLSQKVA